MRPDSTRRISKPSCDPSHSFPELATIVSNITSGWVLELLKKYPTAERIAAARLSSIEKIPFLKPETAKEVHNAAKHSVAAMSGEVAEELVVELVEELRHSLIEETRWKTLLGKAFDALPDGPYRQISTIKGIGKQTAAAIVATAVSIDRFETPGKLIGYFGVFPEERQSGVDKFGNSVPAGKKSMCRKGNDLVRGLLWQCAKCASGEKGGNPAVRAVYHRRLAAGDIPQVAWGYCMAKLLRQVFGVWTTDTEFDAQHESKSPAQPENADKKKTETSGHKDDSSTPENRDRKVVTEVPASVEPVCCDAERVHRKVEPVSAKPHQPAKSHSGQPAEPNQAPSVASVSQRLIDYKTLRNQVTFDQVLNAIGQPVGSGSQHRGPCPLHDPDSTSGRSFSVNLKRNIFRCFDNSCRTQGNVLAFWMAYRKLPLHAAAEDLAKTLRIDLPTIPQQPPESRKKKTKKTAGITPPGT